MVRIKRNEFSAAILATYCQRGVENGTLCLECLFKNPLFWSLEAKQMFLVWVGRTLLDARLESSEIRDALQELAPNLEKFRHLLCKCGLWKNHYREKKPGDRVHKRVVCELIVDLSLRYIFSDRRGYSYRMNRRFSDRVNMLLEKVTVDMFPVLLPVIYYTVLEMLSLNKIQEQFLMKDIILRFFCQKHLKCSGMKIPTWKRIPDDNECIHDFIIEMDLDDVPVPIMRMREDNAEGPVSMALLVLDSYPQIVNQIEEINSINLARNLIGELRSTWDRDELGLLFNTIKSTYLESNLYTSECPVLYPVGQVFLEYDITQENSLEIIHDLIFKFIVRQNTEPVDENEFPLSIRDNVTKLSWIVVESNEEKQCKSIVNFMKWRHFDSYAQDFLKALVTNQPEPWRQFIILNNKRSNAGMDKLVMWMKANHNWVRDLLSISNHDNTNLNAARLILAISAKYQNKKIFRKEEFEAALSFYESSCIDIAKNNSQLKEKPQQCFNFTSRNQIGQDTYLVVHPPNWKDLYARTNFETRIRESYIPGKQFFMTGCSQPEKVSRKRSFPSLAEMAWFANDSYTMTHENNIALPDNAPESFQVLAIGRNCGPLNGYYGVAYINHTEKQIVLSHQGTRGLVTRGWITNVTSIKLRTFSPRVYSAMTFANLVFQFAQQNSYDFFITGHSLGGWLAQVTCFTSMYFQSSEDSSYLHNKHGNPSDFYRPFTVAFDSPGAHEFIDSLKLDYFPLQELEKIGTLPCEIYLFRPNLVNVINYQVGSCYMLDLKVPQITAYDFGLSTHKLSPIVELLFIEGDAAVKAKLIEYKPTIYEITQPDLTQPIIKANEENGCRWNLAFDLDQFLNENEVKFKNEELANGQFEGIFQEYEEEAGEFLQIRLKNGNAYTCEWQKRLKFIPSVKRTFQRFQSGLVWFSKNKATLPVHFIERDSCGSVSWLHLIERNDFVLIVGNPGMGKSTELTKIEQSLRSSVVSPRVISRINLNWVQSKLGHFSDDQLLSFDFVMTNIIIDYITPRAIADISSGQYPIYLLLDGLDEICPKHERKIINLLKAFVFGKNEGEKKYVRAYVVLTTRPHLQDIIQKEFYTKAVILPPLAQPDQIAYLFRSGIFQTESDAQENLQRTLDPTFWENPLMLNMYATVLHSQTKLNITKPNNMNPYNLYDGFFLAKIVEEIRKTGATADENTTDFRINSQRDCLSFYCYIALGEIYGYASKVMQKLVDLDKSLASKRENSELLLKKPNRNKRSELLKFGIVVPGKQDSLVFKHRTFAEFLVAALILGKQSSDTCIFVSIDTPSEIRNILFATSYEYGKNIAKFVSSGFVENSTIFVTKGWVNYLEEYAMQVHNNKIENFVGQHNEFIHEILEKTIDYENDKNLEEFLVSDGGIIFTNWLKLLPADFIRQHVFQVHEGKVSYNIIRLVLRLVFSSKVNFDCSKILNKEEIKESLADTDDLVRNLAPEWIHNCICLESSVSGAGYGDPTRQTLELFIVSRNTLKYVLRKAAEQSNYFVEILLTTQTNENFCRWFGEVLGKDELFQLLTSAHLDNDFVFENYRSIQKHWGCQLLPGSSYIALTKKITTKTIAYGRIKLGMKLDVSLYRGQNNPRGRRKNKKHPKVFTLAQSDTYEKDGRLDIDDIIITIHGHKNLDSNIVSLVPEKHIKRELLRVLSNEQCKSCKEEHKNAPGKYNEVLECDQVYVSTDCLYFFKLETEDADEEFSTHAATLECLTLQSPTWCFSRLLDDQPFTLQLLRLTEKYEEDQLLRSIYTFRTSNEEELMKTFEDLKEVARSAHARNKNWFRLDEEYVWPNQSATSKKKFGGKLWKLDGSVNVWNKLYGVVKDNVMYYFVHPGTNSLVLNREQNLVGAVDMIRYQASRHSTVQGKSYVFELVPQDEDMRHIVLAVDSGVELNRWLNMIRSE